MKATKRQLRKIIKEALHAERIYLDHGAARRMGVPYENNNVEHFFTSDDIRRLSTMTQFDAAHQAIFKKHRGGVAAVGRGYGWWELTA